MVEKEVKILNIDISTIENLLLSKNCVLCKDEIQDNINYRGDLFGSIRLRKITPTNCQESRPSYELTRKSNMPENINERCIFQNESSIDITEGEFYAAQKIFNHIGLIPALKGKKHRKSFHLNGFLYEIDNWGDNILPIVYLEVEAQDENLKIIDGLRQIWSDDEIAKLVISTDGISTLVNIHETVGIDAYIQSLISDN